MQSTGIASTRNISTHRICSYTSARPSGSLDEIKTSENDVNVLELIADESVGADTSTVLLIPVVSADVWVSDLYHVL